jgi:DNA polymerase-1
MTVVWDFKSQIENFKNAMPKGIWDCLLAEYILSEGRYPLTQSVTLERYGVSTLEELAVLQQAALEKQPQLLQLYRDIELPLSKVLWQMEQHGICIDQGRLQKVGVEIKKQTEACVAEIMKEFKVAINLSSPAQVGNVLAAQFKVPLPKTPSGQYATGEAVLQQFATDFPIIQHLLTYRELTKLQNTYIDGLQKKIGPDGKIHTTYSQAAVLTGRLSSSNPNLQNIPVTSALGKQIKACFVASEGMTLIAFDYSQQELRILAHLSQDETLLQAFREGRDIHKVTAAQIFSVAYEAVTKEQRSAAKTINFGIVYGMGSYGLSQQLKIPLEEADLFIQGFYANFPGIKRFFDELLKTGKERNYIETILGRRRYVQQPGKTKGFIDNNLRRELINFPIQGSAADFVKKAMVEIDKNILQKQPEVKLLLQIHDELVFEMPRVPDGTRRLSEISSQMMGVYNLAVPMDVDVKVGERWGSLEKVEI